MSNVVSAGGAGSGSGDVTGPASSTDNALARFDGATGKIIQNSNATLDDSGQLNVAAGADISGTTTMDVAIVSSTFTRTGLGDVILLMYPFEESDADGDRNSILVFGGETGAGTIHYLATVEVAHDGSGSDQNGRIVFSVNDGDDSIAPSLFATFYGVDGLADFEGEVRTPVGRLFEVTGEGATTITAGAGWAVMPFVDTPNFIDTGFSWSGSTAFELTCSFTGRVRVTVDHTATLATGTRGHSNIRLEVDTGGGYAVVPNTFASCYTRLTSLDATCSFTKVLDVTSGDKLRVGHQCEGANMDFTADGQRFTVERLQGAS